MTGPEFFACLTTWGAAGVLLLGLGTLRAALRARRQEPRPALVAPVNRDVTAPGPDDPAGYARTVAGLWHDNPMTETLIVARPLGWDAQPRKEYEL